MEAIQETWKCLSWGKKGMRILTENLLFFRSYESGISLKNVLGNRLVKTGIKEIDWIF